MNFMIAVYLKMQYNPPHVISYSYNLTDNTKPTIQQRSATYNTLTVHGPKEQGLLYLWSEDILQ